MFIPDKLKEFWWLARERYNIKLRQDAGKPRPWTSDPVLEHYHFCNVFRADDKTSVAIRQWAQSSGDAWRACLLGRLANRHNTVIAMSDFGCPGPAEFEAFALSHGINTNAYRINTPKGLNAVAGLREMAEGGLQLETAVKSSGSLQESLKLMGVVPSLGGFTGYQVLLDLIDLNWFTPNYNHNWSWPGPGADRGIKLLTGQAVSATWQERRFETPETQQARDNLQGDMRELLELSKKPQNWPWTERPWTIHEVEFMLCEYDKWVRKSTGQSKSGRIYRGPSRPAVIKKQELEPVMARNYPRLSIEEFGHELIGSEDIDPIYLTLRRLAPVWGEEQLHRWLTAYLLCYHPAASCWLSEQENLWGALDVAAHNVIPAPDGGRWPRAAERRHWRGTAAVNSVHYLRERYETATDFILYCAGGNDGWSNPEPYATVSKRVREHYGFGDWIAYKFGDLAERVLGVPVLFTVADAMYDSPRKAALRLWALKAGFPADKLDSVKPKDPEKAVLDVLSYLHQEFSQYGAPGGGRDIGPQEYETILCKWGSHMNGHYPLHNDLIEIRRGLTGWADTCRAVGQFLEAFPRVPTPRVEAQHFNGA